MDSDKLLLGFIGVGVMGGPMAAHLLAAGYSVLAYDPDPTAIEAIRSQGARIADSVKAVADEASIVLTSLPTVAVFRDVGAGPGGLVEGRQVRVVVDLSTVGSIATQAVATALAEKGIEMVDAPVSGGAAGAKAGTLAVMIAGKPEVIERVMPMLRTFGKPFVVGSEPGQGQLMKLLNNMISSTAFAITSEAYVAGVKGGLEPSVMLDVFNAGSARNNATSDKFPKQVLTRNFAFGFPIASVCKDIGLAVDECQALGVPMWVGAQARQLWQFAQLQGGAKQDLTALVKFIEGWSE